MKRVLVVEDDADTRAVLCEILTGAGFETDAVADGRAAIDFLGRNPAPRVILLDMFMPKMDGWQFRRAQLADREWSRIPVVVVSAEGTTLGSAFGFGAAAFLRKPVRASDLVNAVELVA